jgi:hypothetical protein
MSAASPIESIPTKSSDANAWIGWYDILPFSTKDNNLLFTKAWSVRGSTKANTEELRAHLSSNGLKLDSGGILGEVADFKHGAIDTLGSAFKIGGTAVVVFYGLGAIFTAAVLWRLLQPESVGVIAGTAAKTFV